MITVAFRLKNSTRNMLKVDKIRDDQWLLLAPIVKKYMKRCFAPSKTPEDRLIKRIERLLVLQGEGHKEVRLYNNFFEFQKACQQDKDKKDPDHGSKFCDQVDFSIENYTSEQIFSAISLSKDEWIKKI